jgi:hypothetical protein
VAHPQKFYNPLSSLFFHHVKMNDHGSYEGVAPLLFFSCSVRSPKTIRTGAGIPLLEERDTVFSPAAGTR